jgi:hypothetical protein
MFYSSSSVFNTQSRQHIKIFPTCIMLLHFPDPSYYLGGHAQAEHSVLPNYYRVTARSSLHVTVF